MTLPQHYYNMFIEVTIRRLVETENEKDIGVMIDSKLSLILMHT